MSQIVIYRGIVVQPIERSGESVRIRTDNAADAAKAAIPFKDLEGGRAIFETWAPETALTPVSDETD